MLRSRVESIHATVWEIAIRTAKSATRDYAKWSSVRYGFWPFGGRSDAEKVHGAEEIVAKLRQVELLMTQGRSAADAVRAIGVTEATYYR